MQPTTAGGIGPTRAASRGFFQRALGWCRRHYQQYALRLLATFMPERVVTFSFDEHLSICLPVFSETEMHNAIAAVARLAALQQRFLHIEFSFVVLSEASLSAAVEASARAKGQVKVFADMTSLVSFLAGSFNQIVFPGDDSQQASVLRGFCTRYHVNFHEAPQAALDTLLAQPSRTLSGPVQATNAVYQGLRGNVMSNQYAFTEPLDWTLIKRLPGKFAELSRSAQIHAHPLSIISGSLGRIHRQRAVGKLYREYLQGAAVLDIGCDLKGIRESVGPQTRYVGVDMHGDADYVLNVDSQPLPFEAHSFDTVVCVETLEHTQHIHGVFDKLAQVSRRFLIGSLPVEGAWTGNRLVDDMGAPFMAYQVPVAQPFDRHQWLVNFSDALDFIYYRAQKAGFKIVRLDLIAPSRRVGRFDERAVVSGFQRGDLRYLNKHVLLILFVIERCTPA